MVVRFEKGFLAIFKVRQMFFINVMTVLVLSNLGCPEDPRIKNARPPVVRITIGSEPAAEMTLSQQAFLQALTWAGAGRIEPAAREKLARHVLTKMIEQFLFEQYAQEQQIFVSSADVEREVRRVRSRYQTGDFERFVHNEQMTLQDYEKRVRNRLLTDKVLKKELTKLEKISAAALKKAYEERILTAPKKEQVHVRQILVATEEEASHVLSHLRKKRISFADAAREYSDGPEGPTGGDLGWFFKDAMPEVFQRCFQLELNKVSDVVPSDFGFHIFQVLGKRKEGYVPSLLEVKKHLVAELRREQQSAAIDAFVLQLRQKAVISLNEAALKKALARLPAFKASDVDAGTGMVFKQQSETAPLPVSKGL